MIWKLLEVKIVFDKQIVSVFFSSSSNFHIIFFCLFFYHRLNSYLQLITEKFEILMLIHTLQKLISCLNILSTFISYNYYFLCFILCYCIVSICLFHLLSCIYLFIFLFYFFSLQYTSLKQYNIHHLNRLFVITFYS